MRRERMCTSVESLRSKRFRTYGPGNPHLARVPGKYTFVPPHAADKTPAAGAGASLANQRGLEALHGLCSLKRPVPGDIVLEDAFSTGLALGPDLLQQHAAVEHAFPQAGQDVLLVGFEFGGFLGPTLVTGIQLCLNILADRFAVWPVMRAIARML